MLALSSALPPGNPQRPYPQDIEMRSGKLGRLTTGVALETGEGGATQREEGVAGHSDKISIKEAGTRVMAGV